MITKWKVKNFKSIRDETELNFAPITLFAGANSSGKSSFIQTILLTAQTLIHKVNSQSMVLNGDFANLGQFDDILSDNCDEDQITIKCTCQPNVQHNRTSLINSHQPSTNVSDLDQSITTLQEISCEITFDVDPTNSRNDLHQVQPRLVSIQLTSIGRDRENIDQKADVSIKLSELALGEITKIFNSVPNIKDYYRDNISYDIVLDDISLKKVKENYIVAETIGCELKNFLPTNIFFTTDPILETAVGITKIVQNYGEFTLSANQSLKNAFLLSQETLEVIKNLIKDDEINSKLEIIQKNAIINGVPFRFNEWQKFNEQLSVAEKIQIQISFLGKSELFESIISTMDSSTAQEVRVVKAKPPQLISLSNGYLEKFFTTSLKYLGPLRDSPKPLYPLEKIENPSDIGTSGELTAPIFELNKELIIQYLPSSNFKKAEFDRRIATRTLETAVIDWLGYLGVVSKLDSRTRGKFGHELTVGFSGSSRKRDLTHVGVGVSQVLPIVVMGLLAEADSALIFEQPELHLHPKVQTLLGDFFLSLIMCKKQCIIETHSEYIIDRLRYRIAAASPKNELHNLAKIYFVENSSQLSTFREVNINKYGAISDWPKDFFDQSQQNAEDILTSAVEKDDKFGE